MYNITKGQLKYKEIILFPKLYAENDKTKRTLKFIFPVCFIKNYGTA
jgi:hypothetical protein